MFQHLLDCSDTIDLNPSLGTTPGNYTGSGVNIIPSNVVYNSIYGYWMVTFPVTGFSSFT